MGVGDGGAAASGRGGVAPRRTRHAGRSKMISLVKPTWSPFSSKLMKGIGEDPHERPVLKNVATGSLRCGAGHWLGKGGLRGSANTSNYVALLCDVVLDRQSDVVLGAAIHFEPGLQDGDLQRHRDPIHAQGAVGVEELAERIPTDRA